MMPDRIVLERIAEGKTHSSDDNQQKKTEETSEQPDTEMRESTNGHSIQNASTSAGKDEEQVLRKLHALLIETSVQEGKLVCGNCGFEYPIKEGVGNFLLPGHLV